MADKTPNFFTRLKNRKVYRVAIVYAITAWIIIQVADATFPSLNLPDWMITAVIVFVIIGFPVALLLSWAYEMSPDGFVRTTSASAENNPLPAKKKKPFTSTLTIIVLLVLVVSQFVFIYFIRSSNKEVLSEEIREERVAVAPFNNFTGDASLDAFGFMASEWITTGLRQLNVKTSSPELLRKCTDNVGILPGNPNNEVSLYELTGAKYVVTGSYFLQGDLLQVSSRLESTQTGEIIHDFPSIKKNKNIKEDIINEISEKLKGYWTVKEANLLSKLNVPKYDAYQKYLDCGHINRQCHYDVLEIDSTFILAWMGLYYASSLWADEAAMNKASDYVSSHWDECTEFEKNYFNFVKFQHVNRHIEALDALNECHKLDPLDIRVIHESAFFYTALNQPLKAIERYETLFNNYKIYKGKMIDDTDSQYMNALNRSGQHKKVIEFAHSNREDLDVMRRIRGRIVRALIMEGDFEQLSDWIDFFKTHNMSYSPVNLVYLFNEIYPSSDSNIFAESLRQELPNMQILGKAGSWTLMSLRNNASRAFGYYLLKDFTQAEKLMTGITESDINKHLDNWAGETYSQYSKLWIDGFLGTIYARQGKTTQANAQIEKLESHRPELPVVESRKARGVIPYWQARIYAILGEKENSVASLKKAMQEGRISEHNSFVFDWDLASLRDYKPYLDLLNLE